MSPGGTLSSFTFSNSLTLVSGSTNFFEISKSPTTNDTVRVTGQLSLGGTLQVTNVSTNALASGDNFRLFNAASYNGAFASVSLPLLKSGLAWDTSSATNGVITVVSATPPVLRTAGFAGNNFMFSSTGGIAGSYLLRAGLDESGQTIGQLDAAPGQPV